MANQNDFYYVAIDENGQPYIEHGWIKDTAKRAGNAAHKYLMKIGDGAKARYFYTKEEVQAYYNNLKGKTSDSVKKTAETAKKTGENALSSVREAAGNVVDTGKNVISNVKSKADRMKEEYKKRNDWRNPKLSDPNGHIEYETIIPEYIEYETIIPETRLIENKEIENKTIEQQTKPIEIKEIEIKKAPVTESARHRPEKTMTKEEIEESTNKAKQERWEKKPSPMNGSGAYPYDALKKDAKDAGIDFTAYEEASKESGKALRAATQRFEEEKNRPGPKSLNSPMPYNDPEYVKALVKELEERKKLTDQLYTKTPEQVKSEEEVLSFNIAQMTGADRKIIETKPKHNGTSLLDLSNSEVEDLRSRIYSVRNTAENKGRTAIVNAVNDIYDKLGADNISVEEAYAELKRLDNNMKKK